MTPFTVNLALTDSESLDLSHIIHPRVQEKSIWKLIVTLKDYELSVPPQRRGERTLFKEN